MTVCALPSRDFVTIPTERPRWVAETAALRPAPPAPMIRTSCSLTSYRSREPFWYPSLCNSTTYPMILRSVITPACSNLMYKSVASSEKRLYHAHCGWRRLSLVTKLYVLRRALPPRRHE